MGCLSSLRFTSRIKQIILGFVLVFTSLACIINQPLESKPVGEQTTEIVVTGMLTASPSATSQLQNEPPATDIARFSTPTPPMTLPSATQTVSQPETALRVAYITSGNISLWEGGDVSYTLTNTGQARGNVKDVKISSDGKVLAFIRQMDENHNELWAINTDGTNERQLVSKNDLASLDSTVLAVAIHSFQWQPRTHVVAYNTRPVTEGVDYLALPYGDLRTVDVDTLAQGSLLPPGEASDFYSSPGAFYFSHDGRLIAIISATQISLINADGSHHRPGLLIYDFVNTFSESIYYARPIWAADSSYLLVAIPSANTLSAANTPTQLWSIPIDGTPASLITTLSTAPFFGGPGVSFSPNLEKIAFLSYQYNSFDDLLELHIANADGSNDIAYIVGQLPTWAFTGWSLDSEWFIFEFVDGAMYLGQVGESYRQFAETRRVAYVSWLDENHFIYAIGSLGEWDLYLGDVNGASQFIGKILEETPAYDFWVAFQ